MATAPEVPPALWDKLHEGARARATISYWDVAPFAGVDRNHEHFGTLVGIKLDEVNRREHATGRPLLSAVVIGKDTNMPGQGFFACARELSDSSGTDDLAFWLAELNKVHDYWSRR